MGVWEDNSQAAAYTSHVCANQGLYECTGAACGNNPSSGRYNAPCDKDGCDFNSYRMGNTTFFGAGMTMDTTKPFTVVTQFTTSDGTATGTLVEIRRLYVQNGVIIRNSNISPGNSITDHFCNQQKAEFGDNNNFKSIGGLEVIGPALKGGMVLVMSLWDDYSVDMLWLDSDYPTTANPATPGIARGSCATTSGNPPQVESQYGSSKVIFSNIKSGDLGSTYGNGNEPVAP
jgi:cellulose 1,4-beta-cellobiosidase